MICFDDDIKENALKVRRQSNSSANKAHHECDVAQRTCRTDTHLGDANQA